MTVTNGAGRPVATRGEIVAGMRSQARIVMASVTAAILSVLVSIGCILLMRLTE